MTKTCAYCGKSKPLTEYYTVSNTSDGYESYCKICRKNHIKTKEQLIGYLGMNDTYFEEPKWQEIYDKVLTRQRKKYIKGRFVPDNFEQLIEEAAVVQYLKLYRNKSTPYHRTDNRFTITDDMIKRWGSGLEPDAYQYMEDVYIQLITSYKSDTPVQRMIYEDVAKTKYEAEKARREGNLQLYEKLIKIVSALLSDANIKPVQENASDSENVSTWGLQIKMIEESEPIPEPRDEFKDVDGIEKYITKWFVEPFAKIFGIDSLQNYESQDEIEDDVVGDE